MLHLILFYGTRGQERFVSQQAGHFVVPFVAPAFPYPATAPMIHCYSYRGSSVHRLNIAEQQRRANCFLAVLFCCLQAVIQLHIGIATLGGQLCGCITLFKRWFYSGSLQEPRTSISDHDQPLGLLGAHSTNQLQPGRRCQAGLCEANEMMNLISLLFSKHIDFPLLYIFKSILQEIKGIFLLSMSISINPVANIFNMQHMSLPTQFWNGQHNLAKWCWIAKILFVSKKAPAMLSFCLVDCIPCFRLFFAALPTFSFICLWMFLCVLAGWFL